MAPLGLVGLDDDADSYWSLASDNCILPMMPRRRWGWDEIEAIIDATPRHASEWRRDIAPDRLRLLVSDQDPNQLTELGRVGFLGEVTRALNVADFALCSSEDRGAPSDVVIIGGLPRTGTTLLLQHLGEALGRRTIAGWEALHPESASRPSEQASARSEAIERVKAAITVAPALQDMHPFNADGPEECTPLLQHGLECAQWGMMINAPDYVDWLLTHRLRNGYRIWSAQLGLIAPDGPAWLLKSPLHMFDYRSMAAQVPDARLIHIRREPIATVSSFLNLSFQARRVFARFVDPSNLGRWWLPRLRALLDRAQTDLDDLNLRIATVRYDQLVSAPALAIDEIASQLGLESHPTEHVQRVPISRRFSRMPLHKFGVDEQQVLRVLSDHVGGPFLLEP